MAISSLGCALLFLRSNFLTSPWSNQPYIEALTPEAGAQYSAASGSHGTVSGSGTFSLAGLERLYQVTGDCILDGTATLVGPEWSW